MPRDAPHRVYRDGWPKPEVLCALFDTEALCGFRDPAETYAAVSPASGCRARSGWWRCSGQPDVPAVERLAVTFGRLLRLEEQQRDVVGEVEQAARRGRRTTGALGRFARTAVELAAHYPGDPGVLAALLMNRISLRPLDAIFLPAGNLHAYLCGGGVEIMANSDNVMRGGLTPKHIDVPELLRVVDFTPRVRRADHSGRGVGGDLALSHACAGVRAVADRGDDPGSDRARGGRRADPAGHRRSHPSRVGRSGAQPAPR